MTIQIKDKIHFINNNTTDTLSILEGSEKLLNLRDYSLGTIKWHITCCYRGYLAKYILKDDHLILDNLKLNHNIDSLDFVKSAENTSPDKSYYRFAYEYIHINHPVNYSGKLLLGYGYTGFTPPAHYDCPQVWNTCYKKLIEVELSCGKIINHKILKIDNNDAKNEDTFKTNLDELVKLLEKRRKNRKK